MCGLNEVRSAASRCARIARRNRPASASLSLVRRLLQQRDHLRRRPPPPPRAGAGSCSTFSRSRSANHQPIGERELGVDQLMTQDHVAQLVSRASSQGSLRPAGRRSAPRLRTIVWPTVNDSSGEVSSTRHLHRRFERQVVGHDQVVEHRLEHPVDRTGRRQHAGALEPLDDVVFGLLLPPPLAARPASAGAPDRRRPARVGSSI